MRITQRRVKRHERAVADDLVGRRVPFSGSAEVKGDVRVAQTYTKAGGKLVGQVALPMRIECKWRNARAYTLRSLDWVKLARPALAAGEHPMFHIKIRNEIGQFQEIAVIRAGLYDDLGLKFGLIEPPPPARSVRITRGDQLRVCLYTPELPTKESMLVVAPYHMVLAAIRAWRPE